MAGSVVTVGNAMIAHAVRRWALDAFAAGAHVAVLEGLPAAGKTTLIRELASDLPFYIVELDDLLERPELGNDSWVDVVTQRGAHGRIGKWAAEGPTLVEGSAAWPVVNAWRGGRAEIVTARAYLKAVSRVGDQIFWGAGEGLADHGRGLPRLLRSLYEYHDQEKPWRTADVIFQRVDD